MQGRWTNFGNFGFGSVDVMGIDVMGQELMDATQLQSVDISQTTLESEISNLKTQLTELQKQLNIERARAEKAETDASTLLQRISVATQSVMDFNNFIRNLLS